MIRKIKEFIIPRKKCQRIGHEEFDKEIKIRKEGGSFRAVATKYKAKIKECSRCFETLSEPFDLKEIDSCTSLSMPSTMWDEMREKGYLIC